MSHVVGRQLSVLIWLTCNAPYSQYSFVWVHCTTMALKHTSVSPVKRYVAIQWTGFNFLMPNILSANGQQNLRAQKHIPTGHCISQSSLTPPSDVSRGRCAFFAMPISTTTCVNTGQSQLLLAVGLANLYYFLR